MKTRFASLLLVATALLLAAVGAQAADKAKETKKPDDRQVLPFVVTGNLQNPGSAIDDVVRLDIAFEEVAKRRNWPMKPAIERMASGVPDYETEVRISSLPVRREPGLELVYRAWTTIYRNGKQTDDFGIVEYRHHPRLGGNLHDELDKMFLGYANKVADKLEPVLFPGLKKAPDKPKS